MKATGFEFECEYQCVCMYFYLMAFTFAEQCNLNELVIDLASMESEKCQINNEISLIFARVLYYQSNFMFYEIIALKTSHSIIIPQWKTIYILILWILLSVFCK